MANVSSHLYTHSYLSPPALLPLCHSHCRSISILNRRFLFISSSSLHILCRSQRWDSNAESYNTKNFNFDTGSYTDEAGDIEQLDGVLEDYIDSFWILKVFKSYGWMLPIIIISMLLADGPKAFLLALALPLGHSTFTFAFQRMQNDIGKRNPEPTKTKKRKSRAHNSKRKGYDQSRNDVSVSNADKSASVFGGWDGLDAQIEPNAEKLSGFENDKLRRRWNRSDAPLLMRFLISIFPFLEFIE